MSLEEQTSDLQNFLQSILHVEWLSVAITAVVVLIVTAVVVHLAVKLLRRVLSHDNSPLPSSSIFINIVRVVLWCIGASVVLSSCLNIDVSGAITALGIGGIAISLGFQDTLSNLIGGVQVSITGLVEPGDHIEVGGESGIVSDVTWRHTSIENAAGETIVIPNSVINKSALVKRPPLSVVSVPVLVTASGAHLEELAREMEAATNEAVRTCGGLKTPAYVQFSEVTEYGYRGKVVVCIQDASKNSEAVDAIVRAIAPLIRSL